MFLSKRFRKESEIGPGCLSVVVSHKLTFNYEYTMTTFLRNLMVRVSHFLMTIPNSTISEPCKHLRIAKAFIIRQIAPWRKRCFGVWSVSDVSSRILVHSALPPWPPWSTCSKTVEIICPKWNAYKLICRSWTICEYASIFWDKTKFFFFFTQDHMS